jgi:lipoprotein-anchoring transpeptidase ErfK/SrfK
MLHRFRLHRHLILLIVIAMLVTPSLALAAPEAAGGTYVVQRGDTLSRIAARYGVTTSALAVANGIRNPNLIYTGQVLRIPGGAAATTAKAAPAAKAAAGPVSGRWIDINLSQQRLTAYQGQTAVLSTLISSGTAGRRTPTGRFSVRTKIPSQTMSGPGYYLPGVQYVMYFAGANAIHGTYWHNNFGRPMSHGCVNMRTSEAGWLYRWASIGTPVVVHY